MNKIYFLVISFITTIGVGSLMANGVKSSDIAPYVYPQNSSKAPSQMSYMPDGKSYLSLSDDGKYIFQYDTEKGELIDTIINVSKTRETTIDHISNFIISPNGSKLIVYNNVTPIYRLDYPYGIAIFYP